MSAPEFFYVDQGSLDWWRLRTGCCTASNFSAVLARGRDGGDSKTRQTLLYKLAGEIITGEPTSSFENEHTIRGHVLEDEARDFYALRSGVEPERIGFARIQVGAGFVGCSPDSLVGDDGLLEIKTRLPHLQIPVLLAGELPSEHRAQVQGQLWVTGREWCDYLSYCPGLPPLEIRVVRDPEFIEKLSAAVCEFMRELDRTVAVIRGMRAAA